ncbi:MAG: presqualene diphosphate synthase HpnD [Alphaproteobacteria bacterium]|nr:presqualene diphosphate synthase HpnD [Alphaproteobacteria bacterium]MBL6938437.1 presqualene diphosphate synthase HpnD [Alphaproteobacteria bacterium]MBL7096496.1 presqualene diphosphate synthase HpnD [Alphaproteobacteria bacterium]
MTLAQAQATVVASAQQKASNSSFYSAMRLMPKAEREAMFAIYGFCRIVDDIADDGIGTREERKVELVKWRVELDELYAGNPSERAHFLVEPVKKYGLRKADFLTVIDGMDMDVAEDIVAPDKKTLDLYCERVASAVGRLSIKVFGMDEGPGDELAHHLGRALQLTNILRDIDEDAGIGRVYLPREYLKDAGITSLDPRTMIADPRIDHVCKAVARDAHAWYDGAAAVLAKKPKGRIGTPRLMGAVYEEILRQTEVVGWKPPRTRVSLSKPKLLGIVVRHGLFG